MIEGMVVMGIKVKEGVLDLSAKFSPKRKEEDEKNEADFNKDEGLLSHYNYCIAFELRVIDVILQTVVDIMKKEARSVIYHTKKNIDDFKHN